MSEQPTSMTDLMSELWQRKFRIVIVTLIICAVTYLLLSMLPKMYESSASVLVEPRSSIFLRAADDISSASAGGGISDDVLMSSQVELVKSADTLLQVINELGLDQVDEFAAKSSSPLDPIFALLGRQNDVRDVQQIAVARLLRRMTVIRQRDSRVISVFVRSEDRQLAADIANSLVATLISRRTQQTIDDTSEATSFLEVEIEKLRARVSEAEREVARYRVENDLFVGPNNTTLLDQQLSDISSQITSAQERKNTARSRANLIRELLNSGQSISSVTDVQNSVVIQRLSEDKATLARDRAELLATLLPNHPSIAAITAQIEEIDRQITAEGRLVADALDAEAQIEASLETSLRDDLARLKLSASDASTSNVELQELEREAAASRDLLETYLLRYRDALARTDSNAALPDLRQITVATPALTPASPKTALLLVAVFIVAIFAQLGAAIMKHFASTLLRPEDFEKAEPTPSGSAQAKPNYSGGAPSVSEDSKKPDSEMQETRATLRALAKEKMLAAMSKSKDAETVSSSGFGFVSAGEIAGHVAGGANRLVLFIGYGENADQIGFADQVASQLIEEKRDIAMIDAGSQKPTRERGISDLSHDAADFGEIVRETRIRELKEVSWGTQTSLNKQSEKPVTLAEALCDLNDAVLVNTGVAGQGASLASFAQSDAILVVVCDQEPDGEAQEQISADADRLGLSTLRFARSNPVTANAHQSLGLVSA